MSLGCSALVFREVTFGPEISGLDTFYVGNIDLEIKGADEGAQGEWEKQDSAAGLKILSAHPFISFPFHTPNCLLYTASLSSRLGT